MSTLRVTAEPGSGPPIFDEIFIQDLKQRVVLAIRQGFVAEKVEEKYQKAIGNNTMYTYRMITENWREGRGKITVYSEDLVYTLMYVSFIISGIIGMKTPFAFVVKNKTRGKLEGCKILITDDYDMFRNSKAATSILIRGGGEEFHFEER